MVSEVTNPTSAAPSESAAPPSQETSPTTAEQTSAAAANGAAATATGATGGNQGTATTLDLASLSPEQVATLWEHPNVKAEIARRAQAQKDREIRDERRRWEAATAAERAAEAARLDRERIIASDEYEVGKEAKAKAEEAKLRERFFKEFQQQYGPEIEAFGRQQAIDHFYSEFGAALQEIDWWAQMSEAERLAFNRQYTNPGKAFVAILKHSTARERKAMDAELAKLKEASEQEARAAERAAEPSPDLGGGTAAGGETDFIKAFARGNSNDWARALAWKKSMGL